LPPVFEGGAKLEKRLRHCKKLFLKLAAMKQADCSRACHKRQDYRVNKFLPAAFNYASGKQNPNPARRVN
jgi:hypothetical protein